MSLRRTVRIGGAALIVLALAACGRVEYHGYENSIDGALWRQLAAIQDPLYNQLILNTPVEEYIDNIDAVTWDGTSPVDPDWVKNGGAVIYDIDEDPLTVTLSVFIASGARPADTPTDRGEAYFGPSAVFTCHGQISTFDETGMLDSERVVQTLAECPVELVDAIQADAAFASIEVFDG